MSNVFCDEKQQDLIEGVLKLLIKDQINTSYMPEYRGSIAESEGLGLIISKYFKWDGVRIVQAFLSALEDANFHTERDKVEKIFIESEVL